MTLGDWISAVITWGTFAAGVYALGALAWKRWGALALHILSSYTPPATGTQNAGLPDTYQAEPPANPPVLAGSELVPNRDADIAYLAARVDESGAFVYSANKIAEFVGGTRTEVLAKIRAARNQPDPEPDPSTMLRVRDQAGERMIPR